MSPEVIAKFEPILMVWLCFVGACVGSFLNVAVFRLPRRCLSVFRPARSFCPLCNHQIRWYENIPLLSWIFLRARCGSCKARIPIRYPAVELVTLLLFAWLAYRDVYGRIDDLEAWGTFTVHAAFGCALLVCTLIDFEFRIIPDEIDIPGMLLMPIAVALFPALIEIPPHRPLPQFGAYAAQLHDALSSAFAWWGIGLEGLLVPLAKFALLPGNDPALYRHLAAFGASAFGAIVGAGFIYALGWSFTRILGRDAMGFGDVKYLGMIGALTGWQGVVVTILVGCVAGSVGGILHMVWTGRSELKGSDLRDDLTPMSALALRLTGARGPAEPDAPRKNPTRHRFSGALRHGGSVCAFRALPVTGRVRRSLLARPVARAGRGLARMRSGTGAGGENGPSEVKRTLRRLRQRRGLHDQR